MKKKYFPLLLSFVMLLATMGTQAYGRTPFTAEANSANTQAAQINKAYAKCLEVQKTNTIIKAYKNGEITLTAEEIAAIKEKYMGYLEGAFNEINKPENEFYINYLLKTSGLLPASVSAVASNIIGVSKLNISTEEKIELLMATNIDCTDILDVFVRCLTLGLLFLVAAAGFAFAGIIPNFVLIAQILTNLNFIIALIASALYPFFCLF